MASIDQTTRNKKFTTKDGSWKKPKTNTQGVPRKRKWIPDSKVFQGSVNEGQGFALKRKQKVQHDYNKLLRKERKRKREPESKSPYKEEYPEHLRHLYLAEAEKLKSEAWTNRMNRSKMRIRGQKKGEEMPGNDAHNTQQSEADDPDPDADVVPERKDSVAGSDDPPAASDKDGLPMSNRMRKKMLKKTSYQKTKEEFEAVIENRKKKKEEYLKDKQQREEAIKRYKQKKVETFQMLSKKTKKGQPNLNLQMEYLLQRIQGTGK